MNHANLTMTPAEAGDIKGSKSSSANENVERHHPRVMTHPIAIRQSESTFGSVDAAASRRMHDPHSHGDLCSLVKEQISSGRNRSLDANARPSDVAIPQRRAA